MSKVSLNVWGRVFDLPANLECYKGESILEAQEEALKWFLNDAKALDVAKNEVEKYIVKGNKKDFPEGEVDNIFKYVKPKQIYVTHDSKPVVALLCNYKFDNEHGLAVLFRNNKFLSVDNECSALL